MNLVRNERLKYFATLVNTIAAAAIAAGVIASLVALTYGVPGPIAGWIAVVISLAWLLFGAILHGVVQVAPGRPRQ